jgi:hypothetical protein
MRPQKLRFHFKAAFSTIKIPSYSKAINAEHRQSFNSNGDASVLVKKIATGRVSNKLDSLLGFLNGHCISQSDGRTGRFNVNINGQEYLTKWNYIRMNKLY